MFREYTSIPQKRLACQIEEEGKVEKIKEGVARYTNKVGAINELIDFKYGDKKPEVGDYIVKESKTDCYLVKKDLFEKTYRSTGFKLR
jgi:hypothetical protein